MGSGSLSTDSSIKGAATCSPVVEEASRGRKMMQLKSRNPFAECHYLTIEKQYLFSTCSTKSSGKCFLVFSSSGCLRNSQPTDSPARKVTTGITSFTIWSTRRPYAVIRTDVFAPLARQISFFICSITLHPFGVIPIISVATPSVWYVSKKAMRAIG